MIIGLDIDNVITDLDKTFLQEFLKEDKNKRNAGIINKSAKHITEGMLDWSSQEIHDFLVSDMERMSMIFEPIQNAKIYIDKLKEDGHKIYLVTHRNYHIFKNPKNRFKIKFNIFDPSKGTMGSKLKTKIKKLYSFISLVIMCIQQRKI